MNPDDNKFKGDWEWKNQGSPQSKTDPFGTQGFFRFTFKVRKRWNHFWPYSTWGGFLCKRDKDGRGYYSINGEGQEKTRWNYWRNCILWRITRLLGK